MRKIMIDCDPGQDDAIAILLAFAASDIVDVVAVTTVGGNHHLDKITKNAQLILQTLKSNVPLYAGCHHPMTQPLPIQPDAHGESGMDGLSSIPEIVYPLSNQHAVEAYRQYLENHDSMTIVALGPLTNIAMLLQLYPEVKSSIKEIVMMGGGIDRGNVTPYAEFNIYADPEAAKIVFDSGIDITMCGLDVTEKAYLTKSDIERLKNDRPISMFAYELLCFYYESGKQFGFDVATMHDPSAFAVIVRPDLFTITPYAVEISLDGITRGMTCVDRRKQPANKANVNVVMDVDQPAFARYVLESILSLDEALA